MRQPKYKIKRYNADHEITDLENIINNESEEGWEIVSLSEIAHFTTIVYFNMNFAVTK